MRIRELRDGARGSDEEEVDEEARGGGQVAALARLKAKRALVGAGARVLFYPTLLYNVLRNRFETEFRWWDRIDQYVLLGAVPFSSDVPRLKQLGVKGVVTLNEPYETLVPTSLYQAHGINHLQIPTRDYLFAPSLEDISEAVDFIHRNASQGGTTYVHCKAGRGRSTTVVLCYLIKYRNMSPKAALDHARSVRPRVLLAPSQWQAVELFSTLNTKCNSLRSSNITLSARCGEPFGILSSRCFSFQSSNQTRLAQSCDEGIANTEVDGYTIKIDNEHFVLPFCQSTLSSSGSPSRCNDAVFVTEADLEGYENYADVGKYAAVTAADLEGYENYADAGEYAASAEMVVHHKPIMSKISCLFGSLKLASNCASHPPSRRLPEVHAY